MACGVLFIFFPCSSFCSVWFFLLFFQLFCFFSLGFAFLAVGSSAAEHRAVPVPAIEETAAAQCCLCVFPGGKLFPALPVSAPLPVQHKGAVPLWTGGLRMPKAARQSLVQLLRRGKGFWSTSICDAQPPPRTAVHMEMSLGWRVCAADFLKEEQLHRSP